MCQRLTRREWLELSAGSLAGMLALPRSLESLHATVVAPNATDMEVALQVARWIRKSRVDTPAGVAWPADPPEGGEYR